MTGTRRAERSVAPGAGRVGGLALALAVVLAVLGLAAAGPGAARADDAFRVDVLGDSIASGFGVGDGIADELRCSRMLPTDRCDHVDRAYGRAFADRLRPADTGGRRVAYRNLAEGGERTWDLWPLTHDPPGYGSRRGRVDRVVRDDPDVVLVTLGANDVLSGGGLLGIPTCALSRACAQRRLATVRTRRRVRGLLRRLATRTTADVFVVLYYRPTADLGNLVSVVNATVRAAAHGLRHGPVLVEPPSFRRHACLTSQPWVVPADCFHPNPRGAEVLAGRVLSAFRRRAA